MKDRLYLHVPDVDEMWYRRRIMLDPDTMSYNRGYDLETDGYDRQTGCIEFPQSKWQSWCDHFIDNEPDRFYAYVARREDLEFVGEVNLHKAGDGKWHELGIVIENQYRGMGYAGEAMELLLQVAFEVCGAEAVHNAFEKSRDSAVKLHRKAGFRELEEKDGLLEFVITKDEYEAMKKARPE
jgi:RimJ/RimL family protein N-acetyltransferase